MTEPEPAEPEITQLLADWRAGVPTAKSAVYGLVYPELRKIAARHMKQDRREPVLQTTALVHEAYVKLAGGNANPSFESRSHFYAVSAQVMRQILVDHARSRGRVKRGGGAVEIELDEGAVARAEGSPEILVLNETLDRLAAHDERKAKVVEMRFFGGMSVEETAEVLNVSPNTVIRDWRLARTWIKREMRKEMGLE